MPTGSHEAWQQAQVLALRQMSELLSAQTKRIEGLTDKVDEVRDRLTRLEAVETSKAIEALEVRIEAAAARIARLESDRDKAVGVAAFSGWMARTAPWLFAGIAAFLAGIGMKDFQP